MIGEPMDLQQLLDLVRKAVREELEAARQTDQRLCTMTELAKLYRKSPSYIRDLCRAGLLPAIERLMPGGRMGYLVTAADAARIIPQSPRVK